MGAARRTAYGRQFGSRLSRKYIRIHIFKLRNSCTLPVATYLPWVCLSGSHENPASTIDTGMFFGRLRTKIPRKFTHESYGDAVEEFYYPVEEPLPNFRGPDKKRSFFWIYTSRKAIETTF